ncbi:10113_t:CDS:1, partial [Entrophospora sp. SA101]
CWQDDPESRPDIQYVETRLNGMVSSSNIIDKEKNDKLQKNKDISSFSHPNAILTESTTMDSLQAKFDSLRFL